MRPEVQEVRGELVLNVNSADFMADPVAKDAVRDGLSETTGFARTHIAVRLTSGAGTSSLVETMSASCIASYAIFLEPGRSPQSVVGLIEHAGVSTLTSTIQGALLRRSSHYTATVAKVTAGVHHATSLSSPINTTTTMMLPAKPVINSTGTLAPLDIRSARLKMSKFGGVIGNMVVKTSKPQLVMSNPRSGNAVAKAIAAVVQATSGDRIEVNITAPSEGLVVSESSNATIPGNLNVNWLIVAHSNEAAFSMANAFKVANLTEAFVKEPELNMMPIKELSDNAVVIVGTESSDSTARVRKA